MTKPQLVPDPPVTPPDDGTCGAPTQSGTCSTPFGLCEECGHCFTHCEHRKADRREALRKAGETTKNRARGGDVWLEGENALERPETLEDCALWLSTIAHAVATGTISPDRADKARLAVKDLRDLRLKDQDKRIDELQEIITRLKKARQEGR